MKNFPTLVRITAESIIKQVIPPIGMYRYSYGRAANKTLKDIELPDEIPEWVYKVDLENYYKAIKTNVPHKTLALDTSNWQEFSLSNLFSQIRGSRLVQADREIGSIPLVTAGQSNLGVKDYVSNTEPKKYSEAITIDMFCNSFVHIDDFCCDDNILVLKPKNKVSRYVLFFISSVINQDKYRYQYGKQYRQKDLINIKFSYLALEVCHIISTWKTL